MAIAPGSYSFMGGTVLGKGSEGQFVLVRSGDILTTFTGDEYSACVEAVNDGKAVCVQYKSGSDRMQAQLAAMLADGTLLFSHTTVDTETIYIVAGSNPHSITAHTNSLGGGVNYVSESYTSSDDNVEVSSSGMSCIFETNLNNFVGEAHVRFQNSSNNMSLAQYVNGVSNGIMSTLPIMSGVTHATVPVVVKNGVLKIQVTFDNPSTPSSVKFDLVGYNM